MPLCSRFYSPLGPLITIASALHYSYKCHTTGTPGVDAPSYSIYRVLLCWLQVFDGGLPAVPLVWNPRLTSTAGQVVDDGSQNRLKASREERVPVRLELSTKVRG